MINKIKIKEYNSKCKRKHLQKGGKVRVCQEKCVSFFVSFFHKCKSILLSTDLSSPLLIAKAEIALAIALFRFSSHLFRYLLIRS